MGLAALEKKLPKNPGRTMVLASWVFADDWADKPQGDVCIGLKLMPEGAKADARQKAEELALNMHPKGGVNAVDAFNDGLMRLMVAFAMCDPNDVTLPWSGMQLAEDEVHLALTSRGARFIYEAIERYEVESSPLNPELTDEEIDELVDALEGGRLSLIVISRAKLARRFLRYALDELRTAPTRID